MTDTNDPTKPMRQRASEYAEVDQGTACTQSSFKTGKKSFFFCGQQGGRYKAMLKLGDSFEEAKKQAAAKPDNYQAGKPPWVTLRFTAEDPIPEEVWQRWMDESYELSRKK